MTLGKKIPLLLCVFLAQLPAQEALYPDFSQLQGLFWVNRVVESSDTASAADGSSSDGSSSDGSSSDGSSSEKSNDDYMDDVLELCRQWFSGMIYGYDFYYQPSDSAREVREIFTLSPVHRIPWGDSGLEYLGSIEENASIEIALRYFTKEHEVSRLKGWRSSSFPNSTGQAETPDRGDLQSRVESFQEAVKQALRSHFRALIRNKPKEIRGRIALFAMPRSFAASGLIHSTVKITIDTDSVLAYRQF